MKTILIMLSTLLALATSSAQAVTVTVQSEMTVISDPDNSLVVYKITEAMRVPNVPEGISAGNAYDLVTGKRDATKENLAVARFASAMLGHRIRLASITANQEREAVS